MATTTEDILQILREIAETQRENTRKFLETDRKFQETDRRLREVTANIGKLGNRLGDFIEDAVRPAAVRLFRERGIDVHEVHQNVGAQRDGEGLELDLLVVNDTDLIGVECKSLLSVDDVNEHLQRLAKLKRLLPSYADKRVFGALAAMVIPDNVAQYAYRKGLYVIGQSGGHLAIRNAADFVASAW
ncbi:MAG: DUF3782 domain-containing protein [Candidatus Methylumidiphilus sp.]